VFRRCLCGKFLAFCLHWHQTRVQGFNLKVLKTFKVKHLVARQRSRRTKRAGGRLATFRFTAFSARIHFPVSWAGSVATRPLMQTVETVEKVIFQKLFLKSGTDTPKSVWFLFFRTTFWQFSSLLWEIFMNIFQTRGFSTVSLGAYNDRLHLESI
jgi:hypothetical protein